MKWKIKPLLLSFALIPILILSLFSDSTKGLWAPLDVWFFRSVHSWISESYFWQNFWAIANHRLTDFLVEDIGFLLFFFWIIKASPQRERTRKAAECLFVLLYGTCIILLANELLFRCLISVHRKSPSVVLDGIVNLQEIVTWIKVKTKAAKSFPSDHATTTLISIVGFFYLARDLPKIRFITLVFALFLTLPRLVVGAHWFTDVMIGSASIVLFFSAIAFFSPFGEFCIHKIEKGFSKAKKLGSTMKTQEQK